MGEVSSFWVLYFTRGIDFDLMCGRIFGVNVDWCFALSAHEFCCKKFFHSMVKKGKFFAGILLSQCNLFLCK